MSLAFCMPTTQPKKRAFYVKYGKFNFRSTDEAFDVDKHSALMGELSTGLSLTEFYVFLNIFATPATTPMMKIRQFWVESFHVLQKILRWFDETFHVALYVPLKSLIVKTFPLEFSFSSSQPLCVDGLKMWSKMFRKILLERRKYFIKSYEKFSTLLRIIRESNHALEHRKICPHLHLKAVAGV